MIKHFYTLNEFPLEETGCLGRLYYLVAAQAPNFLTQPLSRTQSVKSSWYPTTHLAILVWLTGHHATPLVNKYFHPTLPSEAELPLGVASILKMCLCTSSVHHILSLIATSSINNSGLVFICVKIMNVFIGGEEISKLAVYSSEKYHSSQSAAYLRIYQNFSLKTTPLKNTFSKLLPQKIFFPNCSLKKYISKFFWKNGSFKNYIFKIFS